MSFSWQVSMTDVPRIPTPHTLLSSSCFPSCWSYVNPWGAEAGSPTDSRPWARGQGC